MAFTNGLMVGNLKVIGIRINYMDVAFIPGLMGVLTKEIILKIRSKDLEFTFGLMASVMKDCGLMENNMVKESLRILKGGLELVNGQMESVQNGLPLQTKKQSF